MATTLRYKRTADRPAAKLWLQDDDGSLIDFSTVGYTFSFKVGRPGRIPLLTKTSGIAGAVGAGTEPTGTPNITITWSAGELNITPGEYEWELTATISSLDRVFTGAFIVDEVIA